MFIHGYFGNHFSPGNCNFLRFALKLDIVYCTVYMFNFFSTLYCRGICTYHRYVKSISGQFIDKKSWTYLTSSQYTFLQFSANISPTLLFFIQSEYMLLWLTLTRYPLVVRLVSYRHKILSFNVFFFNFAFCVWSYFLVFWNSMPSELFVVLYEKSMVGSQLGPLAHVSFARVRCYLQ